MFTFSIFRRAIKVKNIDDFDTVMSSWKSFEYCYGTSEQIRDCHEVCDKIIDNYNRSLGIKAAKPQKRKPESENESKTSEKRQKTSAEKAPKAAQKSAQKPATKAASKPVEKKKPEEKHAEHDFGGKDDVTVFLSNLSYESTKEQVIEALPELNIKDFTLVVGPGGRSKGYGYLELSNPSEVPNALKLDRLPINGRPVFISKVSRDKSSRTGFKYSEDKEPSKIFIKGLPFDATKDELNVLFSSFGTIKDIRMVIKK